jgi:hypothetical protein
MPNSPNEALNYSCLLVFLFNAQTRGEVTLQSSDPDCPVKGVGQELRVERERTVRI